LEGVEMNQQSPEKNSIIKRYALLILAMIPLLGVSGCMKQPTENENKANEKAMLSYLSNKYKREFTSVEYIPAKRGFNDFENKNILVAKSVDGGILVNTKERVGKPSQYFDDYLNSYASKLMENKIDYSGIKNLQGAKTYITLEANENNLKEYLNGEFSLSSEKVSGRFCVISISDQADDEVLRQLYGVYKQMYSIDDKNTFVVAFGGNRIKAEKYVNNNLLYFTQDWEKYDESVEEILNISEEGLSFNQFKKHLRVVGG
jgi:hypothetical protein